MFSNFFLISFNQRHSHKKRIDFFFLEKKKLILHEI